ncbi:glutathione S-transferase family protein [Roseateles terrae]|uniref:Glutathione S-transferase n=1 Tax=Roseateles terrae TaxID=431060 RepID=A0ABR6GRS2_9BURK|nr:glutathione S-transferase family protein [Roseateles terrae]MBB3194811.1 glutathione S-transferase [Roseateles terrae]OWQ85919.1 glutathione S-transferase [Roseateles terrae]
MIELHYFPSNASMAPHILLQELGVDFQLRLVDRNRNEHKSPEFLKLNPNGLLPVLCDGDLVLHETAAILLHLADTHPDVSLVPPLGSKERALTYKWLMWLTNTLQPALIAYYYPERWVAEGNTAGAAEVKAAAEARIGGQLDLLAAEFERHGGPWLLGERYSLLDPLVFMLCRWTRGFAHPARARPVLGAYLDRMAQRPAVVRALETEALPKPWY